ncbi:MAG TPA: ATP-binding protein [Tepidisphaeraceae bacterium]|jgi:PAS domain S-box-containing protein|nr:ATP-binding protein [Tepidisphaeraceae bacterium]
MSRADVTASGTIPPAPAPPPLPGPKPFSRPRGFLAAPIWKSPAAAAVVSGTLIAATLAQRFLWFAGGITPVGFGVPIVIIALFRRRRVLWLATAVFVCGSILKATVGGPMDGETPRQEARDCCLIDFDLLLVAFVCDRWIIAQRSIEKRTAELEVANHELIGREEEIARQNEELQSQTEELERQHEELTVSNDELARRERTLEVLLALSRSLAVQGSQQEMMQRICDSLSALLEAPAQAAAISEKQGDDLVVRCHAGFGPAGLAEERFPIVESFAALVLARGQTGYLENLADRPDLRVPQPTAGEHMASVLASPLRVGGTMVGTIEIYSRQPTVWNEAQIGMMESLASQASISLEAGHLFETVNAERQRSQTVLRTAPVGIAVISADGKDLRVNPAGAMMFGCPANENLLVGTNSPPWALWRSGVPLSAEQTPLARALAGRDVAAEEVEIAVDARRLVVLKNARPIRNGAGKVTGAVAAFTDITRIKELQRELDQRRREAEESSIRKTHFLAAVSHDIRTPANAINLIAELIGRTWAVPAMSAELPELTRELKTSASALVELLNDVLDIARYDSGKIELQLGEFDVDELAEEQVQNLRRVATAKNLALECALPGPAGSNHPITITSDRMKLARVLANLVGNAIKFTETGSITVRVEDAADAVSISVADTGIGIPPDMLGHIFEEFVQLRNPERDRNKGTGLGLSICRRLVVAMGGTLSVASTIGQGSTFTVRIPKSAASAPAPSAVAPC